MADEVPVQLADALDRLLDALHQALVRGGGPTDAVYSALRRCASLARELEVPPEQLLVALRRRFDNAAAPPGVSDRQQYFRALVTLAIAGYFADPGDADS